MSSHVEVESHRLHDEPQDGAATLLFSRNMLPNRLSFETVRRQPAWPQAHIACDKAKP